MIPVVASPFTGGGFVLPDRQGNEQLIVALKATYDLSPAGRVTVAEQQDPLVLSDELRGEPGKSSIVREGEIAPPKPLGTDVFLLGCAVAPRPGTRQMTVGLRLGPVSKSALIFGYRAWHEGALGASRHTDPEPFEKVPLVYELAFGGEDKSANDSSKWEGEPRNPVGRGFRAKASRVEWRDTLLPNIEDPSSPVRSPNDRPVPVGFGPIGRHWLPRAQYAGTYDARWQQERMPLLPEDFDDRFHHAAPPDQIVVGRVNGSEPVDVMGCTPQGSLHFVLPTLHPVASVGSLLRDFTVELRCDTVTVDTERMKLVMLFKGAIPMARDLVLLESITISQEAAAP
jgi:hypothetical protein